MMKIPLVQARRDNSHLVPVKHNPDQNIALETSGTVEKKIQRQYSKRKWWWMNKNKISDQHLHAQHYQACNVWTDQKWSETWLNSWTDHVISIFKCESSMLMVTLEKLTMARLYSDLMKSQYESEQDTSSLVTHTHSLDGIDSCD